METWILIIAVHWGVYGSSMITIPGFGSKAACEASSESLPPKAKTDTFGWRLETVCLQKFGKPLPQASE